MDNITKQNKGLPWKVGMIFVFYFIPVIILIFLFVLVSRFSGLNINLMDHLIISRLVGLVITVISLYYGVNYIYKKSVIVPSDITKIIVWFIVVNLILNRGDFANFNTVSLSLLFVVLVINSLAIYLFFKLCSKKAVPVV